MSFSGSVAVVTGGSKGIGASIAKSLAKRGLKVVINYSSSEDDAFALSENIKKDGGSCDILRFNVADFEESGSAFNEIIGKYKRIDYLVNNAGITADNLMLRMKEDEFDRVIAVNLKGVFNCTKHVIKPMIKNRFGSIVNISSVIGLMGNAGQANYAASKAGVIGLTKSLAKELGSRNIRINAIAPGFIETSMTRKLNILQRKVLIDSIALKRLGKPEDVANLAVFLLSDEAGYITGETINISGGLYI